jgi:hypothetical protein
MPDGVSFPDNTSLVFATIVEVCLDESLDVLVVWSIDVCESLEVIDYK